MASTHMLGGVVFAVAPLPVEKATRSGESDPARHDILGGAPLYENVGEGERKIKLRGCTFPMTAEWRGGEAAIDALEAMRRDGAPRHLQRADGRPMGWVIVTSVEVEEEEIRFYGRPAQAGYSISMTRCDEPSIGDVGFSSLLELGF